MLETMALEMLGLACYRNAFIYMLETMALEMLALGVLQD
jgi:hypothetical protein